jgi:arabinogalactan oligomer/maltooligosaccharide transport system permease protein
MCQKKPVFSCPHPFPAFCWRRAPVKKDRTESPKSPSGLPERIWHEALPRKVFSYTFLVLTVLLCLAPLWQIAVLALEPAGGPGAPAWRWPRAVSLDNFFRLLGETGFLRWLGNSLAVALAVTLVGVILSATAGYALSRFRFFGRPAVLNSLLVTQIFPATMLLLPIFLILVQLRLINTFFGLVLIYLATVLPFCIWQMKSFYDTIPETIEEAAAMDGCSPAEIFRRVILPVSASGLAVTALFSFAAAWNEYVVAAILLQDSELFTLPLGLRLLHADGMAGQPGLFAAGALLVTLPMLALYLVLSRFLLARVGDITVRYSSPR